MLVGSMGAPAVDAQEGEDERTLEVCDDITEPGTYQITDDIHQVDGSGATSCIEVRTDGDVVIEGNGHAIIGAGQTEEDGDSQGIFTHRSLEGDVVVRDVEVRNWDRGVDHQSGRLLRVEESELRDNGRGVYMNMAELELERVTLEGNDVALRHLVGGIDANEVDVVNNGVGVVVADGGSISFTDSRFNGNDGYGFDLRHMTHNARLDNVEVSGNDGPGVRLVSMDSSMVIADSSITDNGGPGIDGTRSSHEVELNDVRLEDNADAALAGTTDRNRGLTATATDLTLETGVTADFEEQELNLSTSQTDWSATDAVTVAGEDVEVTFTFEHGGDRGELWQETQDGWEKQAEYPSAGSFKETLGVGTWTADGADEQTPTPTERTTQTPTETNTQTETATGTETATPTETATAEPTPTATPTATQTETPTPTESGGGGGPGGYASRGGSTATETPTETSRPTEGSTATVTPGSAETRTETGGSPTEPAGGTESSPPADADEPTDSPDETYAGAPTADEGLPDTEADDDVSITVRDGPGFGPLVALLALSLSALLCRRR